MKTRKVLLILCTALLAGFSGQKLGLGAGTDGVPQAAPTGLEPLARPVPVGQRRIVGYFTQWGIYRRNYQVKNVAVSGAAERLTHLHYAFSSVSAELQCASGDPYADYEKAFSASESVDGVADPTSGASLRGNFNQLRKLKQLYPHLKTVISIGGWTWSDRFSEAALPRNRERFVSSCIEMYLEGRFAPGITDPNVFDGIEIDWEYPGACGNTCNFRSEDTPNFTALLAEFRRQLDALTSRTAKHYTLTIVAPAGPEKFTKIELAQVHPYVDYINLMTYDFHGAWTPETNFHSPLYGASSDPTFAQRLWIDNAVQSYRSAGVPPQKLNLGIPGYGHGWKGVPAGPDGDGLYQVGRGAAMGKYEPGKNDYRELAALEPGSKKYRHPQAQVPWIYDGNNWWTYDDPVSVATKMAYLKSRLLGGAMLWELSGDTSDIRLLSAIHEGLQ